MYSLCLRPHDIPTRPCLGLLPQVAGKEDACRAAQEATRAAHERVEAARQRYAATSRRIQDLQRDVAQIRDAGRSKLAAFGGQAAVRLVGALQRCKGQFSRPPIGPIGQYLTLEDSRWGRLVGSWAGCTAGFAVLSAQCTRRLQMCMPSLNGLCLP